MTRSALDRVRHSFAAKLLLALVGSVGLLLLATVIAIRLQTRAQVQVAVNDALRQSRKVFAQQEADLRTELRDDAGRLSGSNRLPAALDEALQSGATDFLAQTTSYELGLNAQVLIPRLVAPNLPVLDTRLPKTDFQPRTTMLDG